MLLYSTVQVSAYNHPVHVLFPLYLSLVPVGPGQPPKFPVPETGAGAKGTAGEQVSSMATLGATAAWRLSRWNDLRKYTGLRGLPISLN